MQEDLLQPMITVHESMMMAADLKLGSDLSREKKLVVVSNINICVISMCKQTLSYFKTLY